MTILITDADRTYAVFDRDGRWYMTVTVGGVAMYDVTVRLEDDEVALMRRDRNWATALAADIATRTSACVTRSVTPSIDPA